MSEDNNKNISAFTILEVTIVIAIMSLLITIISVSLNRFNEQLKMTSDIRQELNQWFSFRSNLWRELYEADSMKMEGNQLNLFLNKEIIEYRIMDESLFRKGIGDWTDTKMTAESIKAAFDGEATIYTFDFLWKGESMELSFYNKPDLKNSIDKYFDGLE